MKPKSLVKSMKDGSLSLGTYCTISSPELIETMGYCGLNHVIIDHMFTAIDWSTTANMIRAAQLYGVCPIVRVQTYGWASRGGDQHVASEVARALGVGAGAAMVSIGSVDELEMCLGVQKDQHHRRIWLSPDVETIESTGDDTDIKNPEDKFFVFPLIELPELIDQVEKICALKHLSCMSVGIHDICHGIGHPYDVEHPEVWKVLDRFMAAGKANGVDVWVNVGYRYKTVDEMVARIGRLYERGFRTIQVQGPNTLLQHMYGGVVRGSHAARQGAAKGS